MVKHYHGLIRLFLGFKKCPACSLIEAKSLQFNQDRERRKTAVWIDIGGGNNALIALDGYVLESTSSIFCKTEDVAYL